MGLKINNLHVTVDERPILRGVSLGVERGEAVVIMGPNGSGKTTLAFAIMGHPRYKVAAGAIELDGLDITGLPAHERSLRGLALAFQSPVEVPGVRLSYLLNVINAKRVKGFDLTYVDPKFIAWVRSTAKQLGIKNELLDREVNVGFSGGERKRSELLQVMAMRPKYVILDEPDSGLDVDGVRLVGETIQALRQSGTGVLVITHHAEVTKFVRPDRAYVLAGGRVVAEGGYELVEKVFSLGYEGLLREVR
ncbi:MAG: Fe-S cluster assembly ATPase SufC [Acidilobus sp.]